MMKVHTVHRLCNANGWFDGGSQNQYDRMLNMVHDGAPVHDIAIMIWMCSEDVSLETIETELEAL